MTFVKHRLCGVEVIGERLKTTLVTPLPDLPKVHCSECGETQQLTIHAQVGLARVFCLVCRHTSFIQDPLAPDDEGSER